MKFIGTTLMGEFVDVLVTDCPVRLNTEMLILCNKPNSYIINNDSVRRVDDNDDIEEFSYVFSKPTEFIGFAIYKDGFKLYNLITGDISDMPEKVSCIRNNNKKIISKLHKVTDPLQFTYNNETYLLKHILGTVDGYTLLYSKGGTIKIKIEDESEVTYE